MESQTTHVVFGAGQVGSHVAEMLVDKGASVRVAKRTSSNIPSGATAVLGDATDRQFCLEATRDADIIYHCMNPDYSSDLWERVLPAYAENLIAAAGANDARLVVLDNLYMIGTGDGKPIDETTPFDPQSRKGEIRAKVSRRMLEANARGEARLVVGRASDFYGPRGFGTHFAERFWRPALRGKPAEFLPNPENPHTYHFIPDVAAGLITLASAPDDALGVGWMLPCGPAETTKALVARFSQASGHTIRLRGMPRLMRKAISLFMPIVGEIEEMLHQWEVPFVVDDSRFREEFGSTPTDPDEGARRTFEWAGSAFND